MPDPVKIPPPEGSALGLATFTAGFGLLVLAVGVGIILAFGLTSGDGIMWGMVACTFSPFVLIGLGLLALAWHFWRLRREPLAVESGAVSYRGQVLFTAAKRLIIRRGLIQAEVGSVDVFNLFADTEGKEVEFPSPYFTTFTVREQAEAVAGRVAEALGIELVWQE